MANASPTRVLARTLAAIATFALMSACTDPASSTGPDPEPARPRLATLLGAVTVIPNSSTFPEFPVIAGDVIAWMNASSLPQIMGHDLTTGTTFQLSANTSTSLISPPSISGSRVAWSGHHTATEFVIHDIVTDTPTRIAAPPASGGPLLSGNRFVFSSARDLNPDIYLYDLSTGTETLIAGGPTMQAAPAFSGDLIVWQEGDCCLLPTGFEMEPNQDWNIHVYDLSSGTETQITTDPGIQIAPAISGDRIVWQDKRSGNWEIYMYDLGTATESRVGGSGAQRPDISGLRVVWDEEPFPRDVVMHDLSTGTDYRIAEGPADQFWASISGNRIVWRESFEGDEQVSMFEVFVTPSACLAAVSAKLSEYETSGEVSNAGVAASLRALLDQADAAAGRGNVTAAGNVLRAFIRYVQAQSGRHIDPAAATILEEMAEAAIGCL